MKSSPTSAFHRKPSIGVTRARHDDSTSNLMRHTRECDHINSSGSGSITAFAQGSTYTPQKHRMKIALWVARRNRPFAIVEDSELLDIFYDLNSKVVTPSRYTVSRDVKEIFQMSRIKVAEILKVRIQFYCFFVSSRSHFALGISWKASSLCRWLDLAKRYFIYWHHSALGVRGSDLISDP